MKRLRLVFADDHPLVLAGMKEFFANKLEFEIVAMATTPSELVDVIAAHHPDVVVSDFSMPGDARYGDGLGFMSYLVRRFPETRILVVTMVSNPMIIASLYKAGVSGVVLKSDDMAKLHMALETIRVGRTYAHASLAEQQAPVSAVGHRQASKLSPREVEVLRLFVQGRSPKEISEDLHRSIKTISNQKRSAMRKLNLSTDQELISYCVMANVFS